MLSKIFVINIDSSKARWRTCQQQLKNSDVERIGAIDGSQLTHQQLNRHFDPQLNNQQYHKTLTAGEIGCYLSHRKAWAKIIEDNLDFALILEDDIVLNTGLDELMTTITNIKQSWHCIKLAEKSNKRKELTSDDVGNFRLVSYNKVPARTHAQAISKEGARRLLRASNKFGRPVDIDLQHWWERDLSVFGLKPYAFNRNIAFESEIEKISKRKQVPTRHLSKIRQQLHFHLQNIRASRDLDNKILLPKSHINYG